MLWLLSLLISPIPAFAQLSSPQFQLNPANPTAPTFTVQGVVINSVTGLPVHAALVQIHFPRQNSLLTAADGKFRFEGIPQGQINLTVRKPGFFSEQELRQGAPYVDHPIQVGPDMPPVVLKLVPEGVIYGRATGPDGEPVNNVPVRLLYGALTEGERNWQQRGGGQTNDEGEFRLFGLAPGIYYLIAGPRASPMPPPGQGSDAVNLTVYAARGVTQVEGVAQHDGRPVAGAMILLVPQNFTGDPLSLRRDQSDSDGTFMLPQVLPGSYTVVAVENGWDQEWSNPAVIKTWLGRGETIDVSPNAKKTVTVKVQ